MRYTIGIERYLSHVRRSGPVIVSPFSPRGSTPVGSVYIRRFPGRPVEAVVPSSSAVHGPNAGYALSPSVIARRDHVGVYDAEFTA